MEPRNVTHVRTTSILVLSAWATIEVISNHLWLSALFAATAGLLTLALRNHRAQVRYWIWLAASVKFLIPFAVLDRYTVSNASFVLVVNPHSGPRRAGARQRETG